jgi:hypothetical protein
MDIVFAIAASGTELYATSETAALLFFDAGQKRISVPICHDKADSLEELENLREVLHKRIDAIFDKSREFYPEKNEKNEKNEKKKIKVFNCFGQEPEMIEIEI